MTRRVIPNDTVPPQVAAAARALDDASALTPQAGTIIRLEVRWRTKRLAQF